MNFDFLHDNDYESGGEWKYEAVEYRDTGMTDTAGRRIGFHIERTFHNVPSDPLPHRRWVSVAKDGQWIRNDNSTYHATREAAEAWVESRIADSIDRYQRLALRPRVTKKYQPKRSAGRARARGGWGVFWLILAIVLLSPLVAVAWLAATMPH